MAYSDTENAAEDWKRYEDIIRLPHHVSATHPQMPVADRAAQFSPFAALTGYRDAIRETGRFTGAKMELDEDAREMLDIRLGNIRARMKETCKAPLVEIVCFQPDSRKDGGIYVTVRGFVKAIAPGRRILILYRAPSGPASGISPEEFFPEEISSEEIQISLDLISGIEEIL